MSHAPSSPAKWPALLVDAVNTPGVISQAYSRFWNYSTGNQLLAWFQCLQRGLQLGPINTFLGWKDCGRSVKKGEKALTLCMPVNVKRRSAASERLDESVTDDNPAGGDGAERPAATITLFTYKPHWFVLCQTEGADYVATSVPTWDEATALHALLIDRIPFVHPDGNCQGFALDRQVAVSPIAYLPHRTLFHELGHVMLGHTAELRRLDDSQETTPRCLREVEAESVALICCECLGLPGLEFSRGYLQHWLGKEKIPEKSAQKIFKAADRILKAGYPPAPQT
jgi:hypothetical protein